MTGANRLVLRGKRPCLRRHVDLHHTAGPLTIDASGLEWASPAYLTAVAALAAAAKQGVHLVLPEQLDVAQYLRRMQLVTMISELGGTISGPTTLGTVNALPDRLLEVRAMKGSDVSTFGSDVYKLVAAHAGDSCAAIFHRMLGELLDNTKEHANSPIGAFGAAQVHSGATSGRAGVEVAVADAGIGVLQSLRTNPKHAHLDTAEVAIQAALRHGVSSRTEPYRGDGLSHVTSQLRQHGGSLLLRSHDGVARITPKGRKFAATSSITPGTWAWLWIDLAVALPGANL